MNKRIKTEIMMEICYSKIKMVMMMNMRHRRVETERMQKIKMMMINQVNTISMNRMGVKISKRLK